MKGLRADLTRDRDDETRLVAAVATSVQGRVFSSMELLEHARVDADLRLALGGLTSLQLGKKLRALAGRVVGGYVVRRVGRDEAGVIWAVQVATDLHADTGVGAAPGA